MPPRKCFPLEHFESNPPCPSLPVPGACPQCTAPIALRDKLCRWAEMQLGLVSTSGTGRAAPRNKGHVFVSRHFASAHKNSVCKAHHHIRLPNAWNVRNCTETALTYLPNRTRPEAPQRQGQIYFCLGLQGLEQGLAPWKALPNTCQPEWPSETRLSLLMLSTQSPPWRNPIRELGEEGFAGLVYIRKSEIGEKIVVLLCFLFYRI